MEFKLHSEYQPTGDQPQAIEALVKGFQEGNQFQTLLGVTLSLIHIYSKRESPVYLYKTAGPIFINICFV